MRCASRIAVHQNEQAPALIWQNLFEVRSTRRRRALLPIGGKFARCQRLIDRISVVRVSSPSAVMKVPTLAPWHRSSTHCAGHCRRRQGEAQSAAPQLRRWKPPFPSANGLLIAHQNEAETLHLLRRHLPHRTYVQARHPDPDGGAVLDVAQHRPLYSVCAHRSEERPRLSPFERRSARRDRQTATVNSTESEPGIHIGLSDGERERRLPFYPHSAGMSSFTERIGERTIQDHHRKPTP